MCTLDKFKTIDEQDLEPLTDSELVEELDKNIKAFVEWYFKGKDKQFEFVDRNSTYKKSFMVKVAKLDGVDVKTLFFTCSTDKKTFKRTVVFTKASVEEVKKEAEKSIKEGENKLNSLLGFAHTWKQIKEIVKQKKIPVVGHNFFPDLLFLYGHLEKKLTRKYTAFKDNLTKNVFPLVYDTKLLADVLHLGNRTLSLLWEKVKKDKMKCPQIIFKTDSVNSDFVAHNASYDAYITGCVYLALKNRVDDLKGLKNVIRMRLSHFYHLSLTNEEFIQEPHNKNTKTFVFHSKFKNYGDTDEDGNSIPPATDANFELINLTFKNIKEMKRYTIQTHTFISKLGQENCYFVTFDGPFSISQRKGLSENFKQYGLLEHCAAVEDMFKETVYKNKRNGDDL